MESQCHGNIVGPQREGSHFVRHFSEGKISQIAHYFFAFGGVPASPPHKPGEGGGVEAGPARRRCFSALSINWENIDGQATPAATLNLSGQGYRCTALTIRHSIPPYCLHLARTTPLHVYQLIGGTASGGITALALTSNRRLLAVAESALTEKGNATVNIYDASTLKRRKLLAWPDLGSPHVAAVSFSGDGRLCLMQGGAPEWKLVLWTAEKVTILRYDVAHQ